MASKYSALYKMGMIAIQEEDLDKAYNYFKYNVENSPYDEVLSIKTMSNLELERGNYEAAYEVLERYSTMQDKSILLQATYVLCIQEKYIEAKEIIDNQDFLDDDDSLLEKDYYRVKGYIELGLGQYEQAEESFEKTFFKEKNAFYYRIKLDMAYAYFQQGNLKRSADICMEIMNGNGNIRYMEKIMILLGNIYKKSNRYLEAKEYYQKSVKYSYDKDKKGYLCLGNICMLEKSYEEAKTYYEQYISSTSLTKYQSLGYLKLALVESKYNRVKEVEDYLKKVDFSELDAINAEDYKCLEQYLAYMKKRPINSYDYKTKQLYHYSIDELIKHIDKTHTSYDKKNGSIFNASIDLEELVCQIPTLFSMAQLIDNKYYEKYQVPYPNIGYVNGKSVNTLELVAFPGSQRILTMFPIQDPNIIMQKGKKKEKSRIEKFNTKYGIKSEN